MAMKVTEVASIQSMSRAETWTSRYAMNVEMATQRMARRAVGAGLPRSEMRKTLA